MKELVLKLRDPGGIWAARRALERYKIERLDIQHKHYRDHNPCIDPETGELHPVFEPLLSIHLYTSAALGVKWAGLRVLSLMHIRLKRCRHDACTLLHYLDLSNLEILNIEHCESWDWFLSTVQQEHPPRLKAFSIVHEFRDTDASQPAISALDAFVSAITGQLAEIEVILYDAPTFPDIGAINGHRKTLKYLTFDVSSADGTIYPAGAEGFRRLLQGCFELGQLAIMLPPAKYEYENRDLDPAKAPGTSFGSCLVGSSILLLRPWCEAALC